LRLRKLPLNFPMDEFINDIKLREALHLLQASYNMLREYRKLGEADTLDEFNEEVGLEHFMLIVSEFLIECDKEKNQ